ncbi:MAG: hypothetical protein IKJ29_00370 [Akkermansia sp.]|nr:hypothetical protein [Akkermansia sp.]
MKATTWIASVSMLLPLVQAEVPARFSDRAKELLADSVAVAPAEHPLNIVYFLGNDNEPVADYERRLSELMLYVQQFYAKEMTRNGFPGRSFGLERLENGNVKLHLVRGKRPSREYAYATGHNFCMADIKEYAEANPGTLRSEHILVIMPTFYNEEYNDMSPGGVPFYGLGRNCFALDYAHFDIRHLGQNTPEGRLLTKWLGGLAHELGHGLNLPHNEATVTDKAAMGTPLMGAGNYTFGMSPTYLTLNSARLLDRCQVFAPAGDATRFYAECPKPEIKYSRLQWKGDTLELDLTCTNCAYVNVLVQDPPYQVNRDYDAVAFCSEQVAENQYKVTIPLAELAARQNTGKAEQGIDVLLVQPNGNRYRWRTVFDWSKLKPGDCIPMNPAENFWGGY